MCGICGAVRAGDVPPLDDVRLTAMRDTLRHRGPDDAGNYFGSGVALGSRRLSIVDLSPAGKMPMSTPDGRFHIVYNGETYNFADLRRTRESEGATFASHTDTEVVLRSYVAEGPAVLDRMNGMFAFAVWDERERTLLLARDRLGVKPLYYAVVDDVLYFASEEKALFAAGVPADFDPDVWSELLCFRYVAGERTPFKHVRRLLPGHYLVWRDGRFRITRWWNLAERAAERRAAFPADLTAWYRSTFDDSVRLRRIADVPVGVLLSGGLDSASIAAALGAADGAGAATFTVRFPDASYDEGPLARQVAERWRLDRHELMFDDDARMRLIEDCTRLLDQPLAHGNDSQVSAISRYAKSRVTVLLSGEGADETLGGYVRYQPLRRLKALATAAPVIRLAARRGWGGARVAKLRRYLDCAPLERLPMFNSCDVYPQELRELGLDGDVDSEYREAVFDEARRAYPSEHVRQAMYYDQHTFLSSLLDRNDRMTMGASIECRVPFLDYRLVEAAAAAPTSALFSIRRGKKLLRRAVGDRLPAAVVRGRKWGFGVPWSRDLRTDPELRQVVETLVERRPIVDGPFDLAVLKRRCDDFLRGDDRPMMLLRQLLMVVVWKEHCLPQPVLERSSPS